MSMRPERMCTICSFGWACSGILAPAASSATIWYMVWPLVRVRRRMPGQSSIQGFVLFIGLFAFVGLGIHHRGHRDRRDEEPELVSRTFAGPWRLTSDLWLGLGAVCELCGVSLHAFRLH